MIFSYATRLACLCLEVLFLVNLAASIVIVGLSRQAARTATAMQPHSAARFFLTLRLLPFVLSVCVIVSICIPSYLRYEQNMDIERIGWFCLVTSALGLALCLTSIYRAARVLAQSHFIQQRCRLLPRIPSSFAAETRMCAAEEDGPGWPLLALVGVLQPRLIVSQRLLNTLSPEQFEAALSHERAHLLSRDNLKRLLMAAAPRILPFTGGFGAIEQRWERYAELAADDRVRCGRIDRSIALAEALVHVARLGNTARTISLASSLSAHNLELAMRVERLLAADATTPQRKRGRRIFGCFFSALAAFAVFFALLPHGLYPLYRVLESLLH